MYRGLVILAFGFGAAPALAAAMPANGSPASQSAQNPTTVSTAGRGIETEWRQRLTGIREAALRQRTADGGTLTSAHRADYQRQLDAANRRLASYVGPVCFGTRVSCDPATDSVAQ